MAFPAESHIDVMEDTMNIIACDIGGTEIKGALFASHVVSQISKPNDQSDGKHSTMRVLFSVIDELWQKDVSRIGIVTAGAVNPDTGMIVGNTGTLQGWVDFSISQTIQERYGVPCFVENDANGAMVAEMEEYLVQGVTEAVMLTLGTGVGTALYLNGSLYRGSHFQVEFGHTILHADGLPCTCGMLGCAEQYLSGRALTRRARNELDPSIHHGRELFDRIIKQEEQAIQVLDRYLDDMALFLHNLYRTYDPQLIIIGGGVSNSKDAFYQRLLERLQRTKWNTPIKLAKYGNFAGIKGAYLIALQG